jgi:hypothetical protein
MNLFHYYYQQNFLYYLLRFGTINKFIIKRLLTFFNNSCSENEELSVFILIESIICEVNIYVDLNLIKLIINLNNKN